MTRVQQLVGSEAPADVDGGKPTPGVVVWFTGLPSSGKSSFAERVQQRLIKNGRACCTLDSDHVRELLKPMPGYTEQERDDFYTTLGNLAGQLAQPGLVVLVPATSSKRIYRAHARLHAPHFIEVWLNSGVDECRKRDGKGLYARFAQGRVTGLPGEDVSYEPPYSPDVQASGGQDEPAIKQLFLRLS